MKKARGGLVVAALAVASIGFTASPAAACTGNKVCDTINFVCQTTIGTPCLR